MSILAIVSIVNVDSDSPVKLFLCVIASQWKLGFLLPRCSFVSEGEARAFVFSLI